MELFSVVFKAKLHSAPDSERAEMKPLLLSFVSTGGDLSQSGRGRRSVLPLGLRSQCPRQIYLCDTAKAEQSSGHRHPDTESCAGTYKGNSSFTDGKTLLWENKRRFLPGGSDITLRDVIFTHGFTLCYSLFWNHTARKRILYELLIIISGLCLQLGLQLPW